MLSDDIVTYILGTSHSRNNFWDIMQDSLKLGGLNVTIDPWACSIVKPNAHIAFSCISNPK